MGRPPTIGSNCFGSGLSLGPAAEELTQNHELELITLASMHNPIWEPFACPLCFAWKPLENPGGFQTHPSST